VASVRPGARRRPSSRFTFRERRSPEPDFDPADLEATGAYRYDLPAGRIATTPAEPADAARLLVLCAGSHVDRRFTDFPSCLQPGDVLVLNETRVVRARLRGRRDPGGGAIEVLLLRPLDGAAFSYDARSWRALARPGRRLTPGIRVVFDAPGGPSAAAIVAVEPGGVRVLRFDADVDLERLMATVGTLPLPPYVGHGDAAREARYQTVFARVPGSVAAPTASLHFTRAVLAAVRERGVTIAPLVLDVGLGTFRPIETERVADHRMHAERYAIPPETAKAIAAARAAGGRVVAAGTTAMRALESAADANGNMAAGGGETTLYVRPGYRFRVVDALLTNFHLPGSTLLVLVATFGGHARVADAYRAAIARGYRFYSFGDAMFVERFMP